jgi:hypothetical protein
MKFILDYINDLEKTTKELRGGVFLNNPDRALEEFMAVKELYHRSSGRQCIHLIQSFAPGESNPREVKEIAEKFLQHPKFEGFQVSYAIHLDKDYLHTHFIINTVNVEDGHKWQMSKQDLQDLKHTSDALCKSYGLSVIEKAPGKNEWKSQSQVEAEEQGTGWKKEIQLAVDDTLKIATNKADFMHLMKLQGYDVRWDEKHKYILFTNREGKRVRNCRLMPNERYSKETMLEKLKENSKATEKPEEKQEKQKSVRTQTFCDVRDAKNVATSKNEFIRLMKLQGYDVRWDDKHKYISFQKEGKKPTRNRSFYPKEAYTKEALLQRFEKNKEQLMRYKDGSYRQEAGNGLQERGDFVFFLASLFRKNPANSYPRQTQEKANSIHAIKEWQKEMEKGKGLDWER